MSPPPAPRPPTTGSVAAEEPCTECGGIGMNPLFEQCSCPTGVRRGRLIRLRAVVAAAHFAYTTLANDLGGWWLSAPPDDPLGQVRDRLADALGALRVGDVPWAPANEEATDG